MKKRIVLFLIVSIICESWSIPKPMESIANYNVLMVHGAYESGKGIPEDINYPSANDSAGYLGNATLGKYGNDDRITKWLSNTVFEEPDIGNNRNPRNSYVYHWRSFTNPANSSINNAYELGNRTWNKKNEKFGKRRALVEEAQEVKSEYSFFDKSLNKDVSLYGQEALDSIRHNPDLYRQLASRYILIGHSMGGVVSREYVQGNFYNGDVDKIITLDSPHEGTGALNMQLGLLFFCLINRRRILRG